MQDEVNEKTLPCIKTGKLTAEVLQKAIKKLLAQSKKQIGKQPHRKHTIKALPRRRTSLSSVRCTVRFKRQVRPKPTKII